MQGWLSRVQGLRKNFAKQIWVGLRFATYIWGEHDLGNIFGHWVLPSGQTKICNILLGRTWCATGRPWFTKYKCLETVIWYINHMGRPWFGKYTKYDPTPRNALSLGWSVGPLVTFFTPSNAHDISATKRTTEDPLVLEEYQNLSVTLSVNLSVTLPLYPSRYHFIRHVTTSPGCGLH